MSDNVKVAVSALPGVIRESVRAVLASHRHVITKTVTPGGVLYPLRDPEVDLLLREVGNNAAQVIVALDQTEDEDPTETEIAQLRRTLHAIRSFVTEAEYGLDERKRAHLTTMIDNALYGGTR